MVLRPLGSLLVLALALLPPAAAADGRPGTAASGPVAVVELFTSEGCSSCPSADALLTELSERSDIHGLSFHVPYWNHLGWADPFSSKRHSRRQQRYAGALGDRVYTPQMVINGQTSLVGSRRGDVRRALQRARSRPLGRLLLTHRYRDRRVTVTPATVAPKASVCGGRAETGEGCTLVAALVQRRAQRRVTRGENAGELLRHTNVVRSFETGKPTETLTLSLPADLEREEVSLYAFLQHNKTLAIVAAARIPTL